MIRYVKVKGSMWKRRPADIIMKYIRFNILCDIYKRRQSFLYDSFTLRLEGKENDVQKYIDYLRNQDLSVKEKD